MSSGYYSYYKAIGVGCSMVGISSICPKYTLDIGYATCLWHNVLYHYVSKGNIACIVVKDASRYCVANYGIYPIYALGNM